MPSLSYSQSRPDLSGLTHEERISIEAACSTEKFASGPAAYDRCLQSKLDDWARGPHQPDLSGLTHEERISIEAACSTEKFASGPSAYDRCLQSKLDDWARGPHQPDLSGLTHEERISIEAACSTEKFASGPSAYDRCLQGQLKSLNSTATPYAESPSELPKTGESAQPLGGTPSGISNTLAQTESPISATTNATESKTLRTLPRMTSPPTTRSDDIASQSDFRDQASTLPGT